MTELFRAHWPTVFGYLCRRTGDPVLAEELAQETFVKATAAFPGWRSGPAAAWLLADPRVESVNIAAVGFDVARQFPTS